MSYQQRGRSHGRGRRNNSNHSRRPSRGPRKENIHPSKFVQPARQVEQEEYVPTHTFADFDLEPLLQRNIASKGFDVPSPIQDQAIPHGLAGRDVIGVANTGTGKTAAFAVPLLNKLIAQPSSRALIIAPTRELAQQIITEFKELAKDSGLRGTLLIGGAPMRPQLKDLSYTPAVVIGTPGRIKDHMSRGSLKLRGVETVVLDEVDRMLDMGFVHDMREILGQLGTPRQSYFLSATVDHRVRRLIDEFSNDPVTVSVKTADTSENVQQDIVNYRNRDDQIEKLHELLLEYESGKFLIFNETQRSVESLSKTLQQRGFKADSIHGGKSHGQRHRALSGFKENNTRVLVATDVAARGIDIADITHVVNYTTPQTYDDYVHRVGRAGRAGRSGSALTFIQS